VKLFQISTYFFNPPKLRNPDCLDLHFIFNIQKKHINNRLLSGIDRFFLYDAKGQDLQFQLWVALAGKNISKQHNYGLFYLTKKTCHN